MRIAGRFVRPLDDGAGAAVLAFLALTTPVGIAVHLLSELAGLGWHADEGLVFSPRHAYLAVFAALALGVLVAVFRATAPGERRAGVADLIDGLPFRGRGVRFTALSFAAQFGFFALTQIGEGCPLCGGDVLVGVIAAALACAAGALAISFGGRRLLRLALAVASFFVSRRASAATVPWRYRTPRPCVPTRRRAPYAFRYRPPPALAV